MEEVKGQKHTEETAKAAEYLLAQLDQIDNIHMKKMFGGYGFFHEKKIFRFIFNCIVEHQGRDVSCLMTDTVPWEIRISHVSLIWCSIQ